MAGRVVIVLATRADLSGVRVAHTYQSGGFRAPCMFAHAMRRPMPDLLCGTSAGGRIAVAKACGKLPVLVEHFRELAERNEHTALDGVRGFFEPRPFGPGLMNPEPMDALAAAELHAHDLLCPVALGVTVRSTLRHAIVVLGPDTDESVFQAVVSATGRIAPVFAPAVLPHALPRLSAGTSLADGAHRRSVAIPSRAWCKSLRHVDVVLCTPIVRGGDLPDPDGLADEIGWAMAAVDVSLLEADLAYARTLTLEGVDVDVYAPQAAGSPSDVRQGTLRARAVWGDLAERAPVARWRRSG